MEYGIFTRPTPIVSVTYQQVLAKAPIPFINSVSSRCGCLFISYMTMISLQDGNLLQSDFRFLLTQTKGLTIEFVVVSL